MPRPRRRPSAALVVACIALFVALGGVGYAAATISGKNIQNGTITNKDLKNRTLTGKKVTQNGLGGSVIKESSLGRVPSASTALNADSALNAANAANAVNATNATNATNAANATLATDAQALNGGQIQQVQFLNAPDNVDTTILSDFHGLTIEAVCEPGANLVVSAINSALGKAAIRVTRTNPDNSVTQNQDSDMNNGDSVLLKPNDPAAAVVTLAYGTQGGSSVTAVLNVVENPFTGVNDDCLVTGTATGFPQ